MLTALAKDDLTPELSNVGAHARHEKKVLHELSLVIDAVLNEERTASTITYPGATDHGAEGTEETREFEDTVVVPGVAPVVVGEDTAHFALDLILQTSGLILSSSEIHVDMRTETDAVVPLRLRCFVRQSVEVAKDGYHGLWFVVMEQNLPRMAFLAH